MDGALALEAEDLTGWAECHQEIDRLVEVRADRGNPFFVEQLARHLRESDVLTSGEDGARLHRAPQEAAPSGVQSLVRDRVMRLGENTARVLELAAVSGFEFAIAVLTRRRDRDSGRLLDALEAAEPVGLINPLASARPGVWAFRHELVRAALYEELSELRRARLHSWEERRAALPTRTPTPSSTPPNTPRGH